MKILISNRGECALRILRAARRIGAKTVAVYAQGDTQQAHLALADETVCIGPNPAPLSYLSIPSILTAARITEADAIHPGYGFLSESHAMAEATEQAGLIWIGPPARSMQKLANKAQARLQAHAAGIPILPGSLEPSTDANTLLCEAERMGYPIMLKAAQGGGGKGMRVIESRAHWEESFNLCTNEAQQAYGQASFIIERFLRKAKHIEVQIFVDSSGTSYILGYRDCSIQKRHQKVIEESFFPGETEDLRNLEASIHNFLKTIAYRGLGTLEFLVTDEHQWYFIEMNMRMQVEHTVTECQTGLDLIVHQLEAAYGMPSRLPTPTHYHAIECRITLNSFMHGALLKHLRWPGGPQVRVDSHLYPGLHIPTHYDALLAKIITYDHSRLGAIQRMKEALKECQLLGLDHNIEELKGYLEQEDFLKNRHHTQSQAPT